MAVSISSYWARLFISALGRDICSPHLTCWSWCFSSSCVWPAYRMYHASLGYTVERGRYSSLVLQQGWTWTWGTVLLSWHLGMSTRASQLKWQKGEAEPRKQKQWAVAQVLGDSAALHNWSTGKVSCSWQERAKVATKLRLWTWCGSGSQAWATWLGWGLTVSDLASLCEGELGQTISESLS